MMAIIVSLVITTVFGKKLIRYLQKKQLGETVRDLGLQGEQQKKGTPTMGGLIIIAAILLPTFLLADLTKVYIRLMIFCTVWMGAIGFLDDYLKIRAKRIAQQKGVAYSKSDADGLAGKFKIFGQIMLGIVVGATLYFNPNVKIWREYVGATDSQRSEMLQPIIRASQKLTVSPGAIPIQLLTGKPQKETSRRFISMAGKEHS
jgi:phospho-N-acetylmuramoyl-pentapeptide-transferase